MTERMGWPAGKRVAFRFLAAYFVLYTFPFPLDLVPWLGELATQSVADLWKRLGQWVGAHLLGIEGELFAGPTGSGDTTLDYIRLLSCVVLAAVATATWSWLDRRRREYSPAAAWLVVAVRLYLGLVLLAYGLVKVVPMQFPLPSLDRLLVPVGEASPMGIVWRFMGASPAYTMFSGVAETVPGLLLLFRRTRTLGALMATAVLTNIVAINFLYDVPVKLFSSHLLAMAAALVWLAGATNLDDAGGSGELDLLRWERPAAGRLTLRGTWHGSDVEIELAGRDPAELPLLNRGFRWINELPYNR